MGSVLISRDIDYAPQIFKNLGISGTETGLFATGIYGRPGVLIKISVHIH